MHILVVSPHRADAAFSCTLAIHSWLGAGHRVTVLNCFTRSAHAPFADAGNVHPNDLRDFISALRLREDQAWRKQQRSPNLQIVELNLRDAGLRLDVTMNELDSRPETSPSGDPADPSDRAFLTIRKAVEGVPFEAIALPLALGDHPDHRLTRQAGWLAVGGRAAAFYEDLPAALDFASASALVPGAAKLGDSLGTPLHASTTLKNPEDDAVALKRRAVLCYDSQVENPTAESMAGFCLRYGGAERLWVNDAWLALSPALSEAAPE